MWLVSWRPTTVKWRQSSRSSRHSTIGTRQTEYHKALPSSANMQSHLTLSFADDGNALWYSVCCVPMVEWWLDCEDCRHLTVIGLHDTGPWPSLVLPDMKGRHTQPKGQALVLTSLPPSHLLMSALSLHFVFKLNLFISFYHTNIPVFLANNRMSVFSTSSKKKKKKKKPSGKWHIWTVKKSTKWTRLKNLNAKKFC